MNHLQFLSLQTKPTTGTRKVWRHPQEEGLFAYIHSTSSFGAATTGRFYLDSENRTTLSFPRANGQDKPPVGIGASGEDGLLGGEEREANRNQVRTREGQKAEMPSALCSKGTGAVQVQSHPLTARPGGLCAACLHCGRGRDRGTQAKAWAPDFAGRELRGSP